MVKADKVENQVHIHEDSERYEKQQEGRKEGRKDV